MNKNNKLIFYQLKIDKFCDTNSSGQGDYSGLLNKIKYFKFLNIDGIILNNILDYYDQNKKLLEIENAYGSLLEFKKTILTYKSSGIKMGVNIDFNTLKNTFHNWKKAKILHENDNVIVRKSENFEDKYQEKNNDNDLIIHQKEFLDFYEKIFDFYTKLGCNFLVLHINVNKYDSKNLDYRTRQIKLIENIYTLSKNINSSVEIILKTQNLSAKEIKEFSKKKNKLFDYVLNDKFAYVGSDPFYKNKLMLEFKPSILLKSIKPFLYSNTVIVSLARDEIGRINSRWGDEYAYNAEASKSLAMLLLSARNSANIYYGDELGLLKAKINDYHDFNEFNYNETKRYLETKNINSSTFYNSYLYQHPISMNIAMPWNNKLNYGFSTNEHTKYYFAENSKESNVFNEYNNESSSLNFYKYLIDLKNSPEYKEIIDKGKLTIIYNIFNKNIIKIKYKYNNKYLIFAINISNKPRRIHLSKNYKIINSTYHYKTYQNIPKILDPFESLILTK